MVLLFFCCLGLPPCRLYPGRCWGGGTWTGQHILEEAAGAWLESLLGAQVGGTTGGR